MSTALADEFLAVAVDIGGTFTDIALYDAKNGQIWRAKTPSVPGDPSQAFLTGMRLALEDAGRAATALGRVLHGTTVATNMILEDKGARTALVTTAGFRHVLAIGRQDIPRRANYLAWVKPPRPVPASRVLEVKERIGAGGTVVEALDEASVQAAAEACRKLEGRGGGGLPAALLRQPRARAAGGRAFARQPARRRRDRVVRRAAGGARIRALAGDGAERAGDAWRRDLRLAAGRPPGRRAGRRASPLHAVERRRRRRRHHPARAGADGAVGPGGRRGRRARRGRRLRHPGHHHRRYRRDQRRHLPDQERRDRAHPARPCRRMAVAAAHGRHGDHRRGRRLDCQGRRRHADGGPAKRRRRARPRRLRPRRHARRR